MTAKLRAHIRNTTLTPEGPLLRDLIEQAALTPSQRTEITQAAADLVREIRADTSPGMMEVFLAEYGLSTQEGVALMCLAEALLRVPDAETIDALIEDKIAPSDWGRHLGGSASPLVNASTWALLLTGRVLDDPSNGIGGVLQAALRRLGEPVIRAAVARAMKEMGNQFVLGETIEAAMARAAKSETAGQTHSYDMLGEAARTEADARRYHLAYADAITALSAACGSSDVAQNPGISVKLSALHPRYEEAQKARVMDELVPRVAALAGLARAANMGFNIDAEEADRLELSLDVIEAVMSHPSLAGWDGFGVVVQAYGRRAGPVIDWLYDLAGRLDRRIMLRLVKGAYWDTEIKRAQVLGLADFPVFTRKASTDVSYIALARRLLGMRDRIYPQFATHNAHTMAAVVRMAGGTDGWEFQRLHGMGETLHRLVAARHTTRHRVYAPVGRHRDLLAYLVRRLLENGANSSFVHQIVDADVPPEAVASDPFAQVEGWNEGTASNPTIAKGPDLFAPGRANSAGFDLANRADLSRIDAARDPFRSTVFEAGPILADAASGGGDPRQVLNPANHCDVVGQVRDSTPADVARALDSAARWDAPAAQRAAVLRRAAQLYETNAGKLMVLAAREAGKTQLDAVGELREAVDFLYYYGAQAEGLIGDARGVFAAISPWNFPLAIFTGQIAAALAAGNGVIAKPAEQTPLMAHAAVSLLLDAGVPAHALQLLPGDGPTIGAPMLSDPRVNGVCFTGGTDTAQIIHRQIADHLAPDTPFIAETGGLNAMVVDSTALPEQAVRDILASAFQSAGQRCSALRCLYVQRDVADGLLEMLVGAMNELRLGDPWNLSTDVGPVIDAEAKAAIDAHVAKADAEGRLIHRLAPASGGTFCPPALIRVDGIGDLQREVFGPVLHVATFDADELARVYDAINATGYGLTFGMHSRIDDRVQDAVEAVHAGNIYINRNQIGAVVGSQPFGGEGLSGTGPKAGGPLYVTRFRHGSRTGVDLGEVELPGPTGESNRLTLRPRGLVLCLGPGEDARGEQERAALDMGCEVERSVGDRASAAAQTDATLVFWQGDEDTGRAIRRALAARDGVIRALASDPQDTALFVSERHVCVDTTAAGGNAALLAAADRGAAPDPGGI